MRKASNKPGFASGGVVPSCGFAIIGEPGPEIVYLPKDTQIRPPTPPVDVVCGCGEVLAHADGADLVLHVWERSILRPHVLRSTDLPLTWNCPRCGVQSIIPTQAR